MSEAIFKKLDLNFHGAIDALNKALVRIRTGRANISMLDGVRVDYYGNLTPISQVASVNAPDPKTILIKPWEKKLLVEIEKAIVNSDLGLTPHNDGESVRLSIPALTEERRKDLAKTVKARSEEAKVAVRNGRRDINEELKEMKKNSEISEDDLKKFLNDVQKKTDACIENIDKIVAKKEQEIMQI